MKKQRWRLTKPKYTLKGCLYCDWTIMAWKHDKKPICYRCEEELGLKKDCLV